MKKQSIRVELLTLKEKLRKIIKEHKKGVTDEKR
jgi:hypothetical protein